MGLFGLVAGLFTASKVHDKIHDDDQGIGADMLDMGISAVAGGIVKDVVDEIFDEDEDDDEDDSFFDL